MNGASVSGPVKVNRAVSAASAAAVRSNVASSVSVTKSFSSGSVVAAVDLVLEGRHFRRDWSSAHDVGVKAAARSLADIAAMGAVSTALLVALAAPGELPARWATDLATARDGAQVQVAGFGGAVPPETRLKQGAAKDADAVPAGCFGVTCDARSTSALRGSCASSSDFTSSRTFARASPLPSC